jgi:hypothetical protein
MLLGYMTVNRDDSMNSAPLTDMPSAGNRAACLPKPAAQLEPEECKQCLIHLEIIQQLDLGSLDAM